VLSRTLIATALTLLARAGWAAEATAAPPPDHGAIGIVAGADLGGGGTIGGGSEFTSHGVFEGELSVGYELPAGFRPELAILIGVAPRGHFGLRPGLHYALPDGPFFVRAALDWSTVTGTGQWRWLLGGVGAEIRLTDVLGGFAEADAGLPLGHDRGLGILLRAGATFRF
jgi:hypothetical protein